jgi:serine-type D-Ala-D-Ala carboxypeptidase (penicillin-binding protein 5/6)
MPLYRVRRTLLMIAGLFLIISTASLPVQAAPPQQGMPAPEISAKAAIVVEYPSGRILYQKAPHQRVAPASTTKIATAIMALEYGKLDEVVTVSSRDLMRGSKMGLRSGERQTLRDLFYGLMLPSGNDAAMTIARHIGSKSSRPSQDSMSVFMARMNARVARMGLKDSYFVNPHGLDRRGHISSAYDLASLTWYAMHFDLFNEAVRQPAYNAPGHELKNLNKLIGQYRGADGVKTGYTRAAGLCLIGSATRNGKRVITVVLNAPEWTKDSAALLDYGFARLASSPRSKSDPTLGVASSVASR